MLPTSFWNKPTPDDVPYAELRTKMNAFLPSILRTADGWKLYDSKNGVDIFTQQAEGHPVPWVKATTTFAVDMETTRSIFGSFLHRPKWDPNFKQGACQKYYNPSNFLVLTRFAAPWPFSDREFFAYSHLSAIDHPTRENTKSLLFWASSVEHEDFPESQDPVRGHCYFMSYIFTQNAENPDHTDIIYAIAQSPKGNVPDAVLSSLNVKLPLILVNIREMIQNSPELIQETREDFARSYKQAIETSEFLQNSSTTDKIGVVSTVE